MTSIKKGTAKSSTVIGTGARNNYSTSPIKTNIPQNKLGINPQNAKTLDLTESNGSVIGNETSSAERKTVTAIVEFSKNKSVLGRSSAQNKQFPYLREKGVANLRK